MIDQWFTADLHYGHANLIPSLTDFEDKSLCRNFASLEEHNQTIVNNINNCVKENDILYIIGDVALGGRENVYEFRSQINCKNIHIILGNHDHHIRKNALILDKNNRKIYLQSLFNSVQERLIKKINTEEFVLDHYASRTWHNARNGSIMLYGHTHGRLPEYSVSIPVTYKTINYEDIKTVNQEVFYKTMDVGIDTHPEFRPYHYSEIINKMSNRIPLII